MQDILQRMIKQISFVFAFLLVYSSYSQEYFQSNTIVKEKITYNSLSEEGSGKKIFSLLGSENNMDIRKISLNIKARLLIRISRDPDQKLTAKISMTRVNLDGNITLRDFNIDALLWPSGFTAKLTIFNGRHERDVIEVSASAYGKLEVIDLSNYLSSGIGDISATISNFNFNYDPIKLQKLEKLAITIDYYYSYGKLLSDLIGEHSNHAVSNNLSAEKIFVDKIEIDRVVYFINEYNFKQGLNLDNYDPIGFIKLTKKLYRLTRRAATLFKQQISSNEADVLKPMDFCRYYSDLSSHYLKKGKLLQPADASGFEEVATIDLTESAKENLRLITEFYNQNTSIKPVKINQCIFNEFVNMADGVITDGNYSDALLLLNNSLIVANWSNATKTPKYNSAVIMALDGVASSYLRVGNVALSAQNIEFASLYFNKADEVFQLNHSMIVDADFPVTAFNDYLGLQCEIAMQYISAGKFITALHRLTIAKSICSKLNNSLACKLVDSVMCLAHLGNLNHKLDELDEMIISGQYPDAYQQIITTAKYISNNNCNLEDDNGRFEKLSYSLFLVLLQRGEILIDAQQSEMALHNFLKAKSIQQYLKEDFIELDRLIQSAAEPEIIKLVDEAKYHTWANRMNKAGNLYQEAIILNEKYFSNNNSRINQALEELNNKMRSRECISYEIKYSDAITKARIVIKNKQFNRLAELLNEAETYIVSYPQCNIQYDEVRELRNQYSSVLDFYQQYKDVTEKLFNEGYEEVIDKYISLIDYYNYKNLFHHDIEFPNLITFITNQKLPRLTMATAMYYLENDDLDRSFDYVKIFREQGGDSKKIKHITTDIARKFAKRDDELKKPLNEALHEYTLGDNWYNHFKVAYLKNRIVNVVR